MEERHQACQSAACLLHGGGKIDGAPQLEAMIGNDLFIHLCSYLK